MRAAPLLVPAAAAMGVLALAAAVAAQSSLENLSSGDTPLEITATKGIEWNRGERTYIARGDARAVREDITVYAETLTAHYREGADGNKEIYRVDAVKDVKIESPSETVYGDRGVYDVVNAVLVLVGDELRLETPQDTLTARDSLEYWEERRLAVARGNAVVVREDKRIRADVITAHFKPRGAGQQEIDRVDAYGDVRIATEVEVIRGEKAAYDVDKRIATVTGDVRITRDQNQLNGGYAEVNLETGVSRLLSAPPGEGNGQQRVRGLLLPDSKPSPTELPLGGDAPGDGEAAADQADDAQDAETEESAD